MSGALNVAVLKGWRSLERQVSLASGVMSPLTATVKLALVWPAGITTPVVLAAR